MENSIRAVSVERAKVYGMLYVMLNLFNVILFYATTFLIIATPDQRMRAYTLLWLSSLLIAVVAVEMLRALFVAGANPLAISFIGCINVFFVAMQLAVYADIMVFDIADTPIALLLLYLLLASIGVAIMIVWMIMKYMKARKD